MHRRRDRRRGMALLATMVMVLLAAMLLASALRTAWLNELIAGTELDYQRSFEHAQALLRDAELDIQGSCGPPQAPNCRRQADGQPWFPHHGPQELAPLRALLAGRAPSCLQGICLPDSVAPAFWRSPAGELDRMKAVAAHYGEFTGAAGQPASDPLLMGKGWYWVEILPFDVAGPSGAGVPTPDAGSPLIYRITAMSEGRKPATRAVLQSLLVLQKAPQ